MERVILRDPTIADAPALVRCSEDPLTQRFTTIPANYTEKMAHDWIASPRPNTHRWVICDSQDASFQGAIDIRVIDSHRGNIGYHVSPWARGRGRASAALELVKERARELGLTHLELEAREDNLASRRVAEKCGFTQTGSRPDERAPEFQLITYELQLSQEASGR
ncbi:GNAT family N-acetyltransferase [Corynebacterium tapiri]|uniref:GNAT family N-acetyltransferase n=1 Tax=Corynebacterium tapiri TaxID=1448266 RepID=A0A5C4U1I4_9CORY|nr:GNAT family N-acetyltransferase [Corynebacterium tapiri]TNL95637.1 GNAT family N-acetyltransferase [Corynebacterium tapiri]